MRICLPAGRAEILRQYSRHLGDAELLAVAHATPGLAGRDLKDICEQAERRWASKVGARAGGGGDYYGCCQQGRANSLYWVPVGHGLAAVAVRWVPSWA